MGAVMFGGYAAFIGLLAATFAWAFMDANWMIVFIVMAIGGALLGALTGAVTAGMTNLLLAGGSGYPADYLPNMHKHGTQEYYLNEIVNQQATQADDERRRRNVD